MLTTKTERQPVGRPQDRPTAGASADYLTPEQSHTFFHPILGRAVSLYVHGPKPGQMHMSLSPSIWVRYRSCNLQVGLLEQLISVQAWLFSLEPNYLSSSRGVVSGILTN